MAHALVSSLQQSRGRGDQRGFRHTCWAAQDEGLAVSEPDRDGLGTPSLSGAPEVALCLAFLTEVPLTALESSPHLRSESPGRRPREVSLAQTQTAASVPLLRPLSPSGLGSCAGASEVSSVTRAVSSQALV